MVRGNLIPWQDFGRPFYDLRREMDQVFNRFFGEGEAEAATPTFAPRANIAETDEAYEVSVELPGMKPEDFHVEMKNGELWITGEKKLEEESQGKTWHRVERFYGQFRRVIPLAVAVDEDKIDAEYRSGVLRLKLPKSAAAKPRQIPIKSGEAT
jgi:HSP20 family protein